MAFTNGSLFGLFDGQATGDNTNSAWNNCNTTNPNLQPKIDLFQILNLGGAVLLRVSSAGVVTTNVAPGIATTSTTVATVQLNAAQSAGLLAVGGATPTAAQICQAAFPANYNGLQLDIFQVGSFIPTINVAGGGTVIFRLLFNGTTATS